jgi:hypothetical protein
MNRRRIFTICTILVVLSACIYFFVFRVSGSNTSVSVDGCDPYNVEVKKGEKENSVEILWKSKEECSAYILYGDEMKDLNLVGVDLENSIKSREHKVVLNSIMSSRTYFFSIVSEGVTYGKNGLPVSFSISSL